MASRSTDRARLNARAEPARQRGIPMRRARAPKPSEAAAARARQRARPGVRQRGPRRNLQAGAQARLRRFRRGTILAVALTALILMLWGIDPEADALGTAPAQEATTQTEVEDPADAQQQDAPADAADTLLVVPAHPTEAADQALRTIRDLTYGMYAMLPRILVVVILFVVTALIAKLISALLRRSLRNWERADATAAMLQVVIWLIAVGAGLSVLAGDARALVGSIGLAGLALSWALQAPIESFTGWLMNSFKGYYRIGDRIAVGDVFGDVYKIDILTTTVWEAGGPGKRVSVPQPTGALVTFPNSDVLRSNIVNFTRRFPYVWDEVTIPVANETDLPYAIRVFESMAIEVLGTEMSARVEAYRDIIERAKLAFDVAPEPKVFVSLEDSWTDLTIRYIVPARELRRWASALQLQASHEMHKPEHEGRIKPGYPRADVRLRHTQDEAEKQQ